MRPWGPVLAAAVLLPVALAGTAAGTPTEPGDYVRVSRPGLLVVHPPEGLAQADARVLYACGAYDACCPTVGVPPGIGAEGVWHVTFLPGSVYVNIFSTVCYAPNPVTGECYFWGPWPDPYVTVYNSFELTFRLAGWLGSSTATADCGAYGPVTWALDHTARTVSHACGAAY